MNKSNIPANVDEYLGNLPDEQRWQLEKLRKAIQSFAPEAKEIISYMIPTFQYKGRILLHYAAFKNHYSLFPGKEPIEAYKTELQNYKTSAGTIQIPFNQELPDVLIQKIVAMRMGDIEFKLENKKNR